MFDQQAIRRSLRSLDWLTTEALLAGSTLEEEKLVSEVLTEVVRSGCLILRHRSAADEERRDSFRRALSEWFASHASTKNLDRLQRHLADAELIERCFTDIENSISTSEIEKLAPASQAWAVVDRAVAEYRILVERLVGLPKTNADGFHLIDAVAPKVKDSDGKDVSIDSVMEGLNGFLTATLQMLGYTRSWYQGSHLTLPPRVPTTEDEIYKAATHSYLSSAWNSLLSASEHARYWQEPIREKEDRDDKGHEHRWTIFDLDLRLDLYIRVARIRQHQIQLQHAVDSTIRVVDKQFRDPRVDTVQLPTADYLSREELIASELMANEYHLDLNSPREYGGLTLREWIRGYACLKLFVRREQNGIASPEVPEVSEQELSRALSNAGLREHSGPRFLEAATLSRRSRDIYDSPLLQTEDGKRYLLAPFFSAGNLLEIVVSQLTTQRVTLTNKGDAFENAVLTTVRSAGIDAKGFSFYEKDEQYECDAAFVLDRHLFVLECKNCLLPPESPAEEFYFIEEMLSAGAQAKRISSALEKNPAKVAEHFGEDTAFDTIITVVLNAMPFSVPGTVADVYYYDYSAFARFFEFPDLYISQPLLVDGEPRLIKHRVGRLWNANKPTAADFLKELESPTAVVTEKTLWAIEPYTIALSDNSALAKRILRRRSASLDNFLKPQGWSDSQIRELGKLLTKLGNELGDRRADADSAAKSR